MTEWRSPAASRLRRAGRGRNCAVHKRARAAICLRQSHRNRRRAPNRVRFPLRLAAEVDALAAQLEASRARINELEARVDIDPLTEIRNRRGFERELKRSLAYVKRYGTSAALVYIDLDGFKPVNDRHGHAAGDAVLKAIAGALHPSHQNLRYRRARRRRRIRRAVVERQRRGCGGEGEPRSRPRSMRRRCAGIIRRSWSAHPPEWRFLARSTRPARFWRAPTRQCTRARRNARASIRQSRSGNDIRRQLVFNKADAVAQL